MTKSSAERLAKKGKLMRRAEARAAMRGAPNFGMQEGDLLQMRSQIRQLTAGNNTVVDKMRAIEELQVIDKALESHIMMQVILGILESKGMVTKDEINALSQQMQMRGVGLTDKQGGKVEVGDVVLIKFKIFDGDNVVDDQTKAPLAYDVGSGGLPCDEGLIGMVVGEARIFNVTFGTTFRHKEYIDKPLVMQVWCCSIKVKATKATSQVSG